jgi:hypothetical protein
VSREKGTSRDLATRFALALAVSPAAALIVALRRNRKRQSWTICSREISSNPLSRDRAS